MRAIFVYYAKTRVVMCCVTDLCVLAKGGLFAANVVL